MSTPKKGLVSSTGRRNHTAAPAENEAVVPPYLNISTARDARNVLLPFHEDCGFIDRSGTRQPLWPLVERALGERITSANQLSRVLCSFRDPAGEHEGQLTCDALIKFIDKMLSPTERQAFFDRTLPFVQSLVLQLPALFPSADALPVLAQNQEHELVLSQRQCAALVASAFFCILPEQIYLEGSQEFPSPNFSAGPSNFHSIMFEEKRVRMPFGNEQAEKLRCLLNYFERLRQRTPEDEGSVVFSRQVCATPMDWQNSTTLFGALEAPAEGRIEEMYLTHSMVDFANEFLGGGIQIRSAIQEQILFLLMPEMYTTMLFTTRLLPNEALIVRGMERFSNYSGYARSFKYEGNHVDASTRDARGMRQTDIIAIDAFNFHHEHRELEQFKQEFIDRELNKAFIGYRAPSADARRPIASGNWGAGVFAGDAQLKTLLQLMACAANGRALLLYYFEKTDLPPRALELHRALVDGKITVGDVYRHLVAHGQRVGEGGVDCDVFESCMRVFGGSSAVSAAGAAIPEGQKLEHE